jgi:signal transduction histidine kinase
MDSVQRIVGDIRPDAAPASPAAAEQLRFELLLLELSTGFINLPAGRIDEAIEDGLRRVVEALGIERSTLNWLQKASGRVEITHSYAVPGVERAPKTTANRELWPWAWSLLTANRPVVFASLDELPPEASVDRANWERIALKSHVTMPLIVAGELYGGLSFGCIRSERTWPAELLGRMRLVAQIFGNALARKHAQEELDRALDFDRLATRILASLLIAEPSDEDRAIEQGLGDIGRSLGVDRVGLWEALPSRGELRLAYHWAADGAGAPSVRLTAVELPWITGRLRDGSVVRFSRHAELPPQAAADVATLRALGVHALLAVPFSVSGGAAGALSFEGTPGDRAWPEGLIPGAMLLAEVFASLHARQSSERRKQAAEVEAAQWRERLAHLVRVHTAGEMSAALAHEITQPLGAIENYALAARRRLAEDSPDRTRVAELLDKVIGQASRAGDVVTRMRGMVQRHELEATEIDVERAVRDCVEMVKTDCELRDIGIELRPAGRLPAIVADEIHLQQVILNLLRNAMEAVEQLQPGVVKRITIEIGRDDAGAVSVAVADRGPGIAEGDLERVFESFYSTKPRGLGIGLAICRKLIEAHGGALWAAHNPGGGAVFRFTLPVVTSVD